MNYRIERNKFIERHRSELSIKHMSLSNHNKNRFVVPPWTIALLVIAMCAGCQTRVSQLDLDAANDSITDIDSILSQPKQAEDAKLAGDTGAMKKASKTSIKFSLPNDLPEPNTDAPVATPSQPAAQLATKPAQPNPVANTQQTVVVNTNAKEPQAEDPAKELKERPRVVAKKPAIVERNGKVYQPYHLNKNQTLLLLAAQPDIRSRILASTVREVTTPQQQRAAEQLAFTFDQQYIEILRQRAAILETAIDGADVEAKLLDLRMTTADLTTRVRTKINEEILTQAQRFELQRLFEESQQ